MVKMKRFLVLFLLLSSTAAFSQKKNQTNAWVGTYKLDVAQSRISGPPPAEETVVVSSASKDSVKYAIQGKDAQGNSYAINFDGKVGTAAPLAAV